MEIQITDFENAAFAIFIVLVTRAILSYDLNFYIPIPRTTQNMETAHARDAVLNSKFWFRKNPFPRRRRNHAHHASNGSSGTSTPSGLDSQSRPTTPPQEAVQDEYTQMSLAEIVNGRVDGFPGLIPLVESYLNSVNVDVETRCELARYLDLIRKRADGTLWTGAKWIREFVRSHEDYRGDSSVSQKITYDLVKRVDQVAVSEGRHGGPGWEMLTAKSRALGVDDRDCCSGNAR
jgi:glutamate--cysteine ligase catalytic subunit